MQKKSTPQLRSPRLRSGQAILIVKITPPVLQKGLVWFLENKKRIEKEWRGQNALALSLGQIFPLSRLLRALDEAGYEKTIRVRLPGEFAQRGGVVDIFPINQPQALRIEYRGNVIESIDTLEETHNPDPQKPLKHWVRSQKSPGEQIESLAPGSYVVHQDHGIGIFRGCRKSDFLHVGSLTSYIIEYAAGDKLYVPEYMAHKLSPYIGLSKPPIYRLGGNLWPRVRRKVKESIIQTARELLKLYAQREVAERSPYLDNDAILSQLEDNFGHAETPDQERVIGEIYKDMEKETPMDRLVCGDVGFGKTEVALRAAAKAAISGRQTAFIAPTTILAWQHWQTLNSRFSNLPFNAALLSRIQKPTEQKKTLRALSENKIDVVVGTHRLLQKDVRFKNLGLLIIDEEQRFGVRQKEKLKQLRADLDVLALSATPIPRTLYFSLSGLKNISLIQTPPPERLPIKTLVRPFSGNLVAQAVAAEVRRGGQVYYLHNRIATIEKARQKIQTLAPRVSIGIAHAKLPEQKLIKIIDDFRKRKFDLLIATTIIENGLDLSNVNTLIVEDASLLGLAQAHQLRGRIGRSGRQAYAYFLYPKKKLTKIGSQRLRILERHQQLGAGYTIALQDLEIRGAGNLLGREQSGAINKVGLTLYCQLLNEAVEELRSEDEHHYYNLLT